MQTVKSFQYRYLYCIMFSGDISKMAMLRSIIKKVNFSSKRKHNVLLVTDAHVQHNSPYAGVTKGKCKVGRVLLYYI